VVLPLRTCNRRGIIFREEHPYNVRLLCGFATHHADSADRNFADSLAISHEYWQSLPLWGIYIRNGLQWPASMAWAVLIWLCVQLITADHCPGARWRGAGRGRQRQDAVVVCGCRFFFS